MSSVLCSFFARWNYSRHRARRIRDVRGKRISFYSTKRGIERKNLWKCSGRWNTTTRWKVALAFDLELVTYRVAFRAKGFRVGEILLGTVRLSWLAATRQSLSPAAFSILHLVERFLHVLYVRKAFWQTSRSFRYGPAFVSRETGLLKGNSSLYSPLLRWPTATATATTTATIQRTTH